ncbi:hypothetical protein APA_2193 [Pseudanabaena sp. lw0831]|nr:hypothetical protein APA_2193 [Pseudanabaena sp. lw0831]
MISILVHLTTDSKIKNQFFVGAASLHQQKIGSLNPNEVKIA